MKIRLNPIVKKDLKVTARSMRISWGVFAYEALLMMAFLLALVIIQEENSYFYSTSNLYNDLVYLFPVVAVVQVCIVALIVPIITASSISGEKERQTFDIMLTTCMSPFSIVLGKVISAVIRILFFVVASMPIMSLAFVVGGLSWGYLLLFVLAVILLSVFSGSIGILCSAFCNKSIAAVIMSYAIYFVFYGMSFVPMILALIMSGGDEAGESLLLLLFNPIVFFEEFFALLMTGSSLMNDASFSKKDVGFFTYHLANGHMWVYVSAAAILLMSLVFMLIAAWRVNPMNRGGRKRKKA